MRTALVIAMEAPVPTLQRAFSFDYGFPRTAILIATCIKEWGGKVGLFPQILNMDIKLRNAVKAAGKSVDAKALFDDILVGAIRDHSPDLICIVAPYTNAANWAIRAARVCKESKPEAIIITGGPHASFLAKDLLCTKPPVFDAVVLGPGEAKLKHILENFDGPAKRFHYPGIATLNNLTDFSTLAQRNDATVPPIDFSLIPKSDIGDGGAVVMAGRGCPNACQFCLESFYWRKASVPYYENGSQVRNELIALSRLDVPVFGCGDSLIDMRIKTKDSSRFESFCQEAFDGLNLHEHFFLLTRLHMIDPSGCKIFHQVGGKAIWVGIETASEDLLTAMGKGEIPYIVELQLRKAKQYGLRVGAFFMFGFPGETPDSAKKTLSLIENLFKEELLDYVDPSIFVPYPGLSLHEDKECIVRHEPEWGNWDHWGRYNEPPVYDLKSLSRNEIFHYWKEAMSIKSQYDLREIQRKTTGGQD
ncbi:MAG: B12-binding domain-containing radical SAM protein [Desulfobulbaceae bacterium]|nr:B12-binding domain-containing radical SAM protein [Desulfobulbaceae bacterium]